MSSSLSLVLLRVLWSSGAFTGVGFVPVAAFTRFGFEVEKAENYEPIHNVDCLRISCVCLLFFFGFFACLLVFSFRAFLL
jgi:hypothetical protein